MKYTRLLVLVLPLLLAACGLSPQQKADYQAVASSGVNSAVYDKMTHGDQLSLYDIKALTRAHVKDSIILRYMRDQGSVYYLNSSDVENLRSAGVSQSLIDYMLATARYGANVSPDVVIGLGYGPAWYGPWYGPAWYGPSYYGGWYGPGPYYRRGYYNGGYHGGPPPGGGGWHGGPPPGGGGHGGGGPPPGGGGGPPPGGGGGGGGGHH